ncbi:MAG: hypothetical protein JSV88_33220 [Candidatus Aminicenantes bacterium]|nr:MAG: hypothetical protein JSV88_33220 [Candidatus Aminicenantes bacterium]
MKVVIDASPLISLAVINQLELLEKLFPEIIIPQAVFQEITAVKDKNRAGKIEGFRGQANFGLSLPPAARGALFEKTAPLHP